MLENEMDPEKVKQAGEFIDKLSMPSPEKYIDTLWDNLDDISHKEMALNLATIQAKYDPNEDFDKLYSEYTIGHDRPKDLLYYYESFLNKYPHALKDAYGIENLSNGVWE